MSKFIDCSGQKIGRVTIISLNEMRSGGSRWNCKCDCGKNFICWRVSFKRGEKFECKDCMNERKRGIDLTGRKYGRWTVLKRTLDSRNKTAWECRCDCGTLGIVSGSSLGRPHKSMSCGCLGRKNKSKHVNTTLYPPAHGLAKSKFYTIKTSLIHKCYNEKHSSYKNFGAKGITVCDLWRNGAKDMYNWAVSEGWKEGDIIILKQGEKEFNPQTCIIMKNEDFRSEIALKGGLQITHNGETHSVRKWADILNINVIALRNRLKKYPSVDEVFSSEFKKFIFKNDPNLSKKVIELYLSGKTQTQISKIVKVNSQTIRYHLLINNIELRKNDKCIRKLEYVKDEDVLLLHKKGYSKNKIAKELRCSYPTIDNRLKKLNGIK